MQAGRGVRGELRKLCSCTTLAVRDTVEMWARSFDGIRFQAYTEDHLPPHVHGSYAETEVVIDLIDGKASISGRDKSVLPRNAKLSDVNRIVRAAGKYTDELMDLWRAARG